MNSAPLSPFGQTANKSGSVPSVKSLDGAPAGKGKQVIIACAESLIVVSCSIYFHYFLPILTHWSSLSAFSVEYAKVMKTLSSPKVLQYTTSLKVMDFLPYTPSLPPPPLPPPDEESATETQEKM